jgi:hypothetical protein
MAEQAPLEQRERALAEEILERIASDTGFRHRLLEDPQGAMTAAGFVEQIESLRSDWLATEEVTGYAAVVLDKLGPVAESSCIVSIMMTQATRLGIGDFQGVQGFPPR